MNGWWKLSKHSSWFTTIRTIHLHISSPCFHSFSLEQMEVEGTSGHRRSPPSSSLADHQHHSPSVFWSPPQTANIGHHHIHDNEFLITNHSDPSSMVLDHHHHTHHHHHDSIDSTAVFLPQTNPPSPVRDPYRYYHQYYHQHYHPSNRQLDINVLSENGDPFLDRSSRGNEMSNSSPRYPSTYQDPDSTVLEPAQEHDAGDIITRDEGDGNECPSTVPLNQDRNDYRRQTIEGKSILDQRFTFNSSFRLFMILFQRMRSLSGNHQQSLIHRATFASFVLIQHRQPCIG